MNKAKAIKAIKAAIVKHLAPYYGPDVAAFRAIVEKDVHDTETAPGGWCPGGIAEVYCEGGIPSPLYGSQALQEAWFDINDDLAEKGFNIYAENVNGAVVGFYEI